MVFTGRRKDSLAFALVLTLALPATAIGSQERYVPTLQAGDTVPLVVLRDQRERVVTLSSWPGSTLVVGFVYTRCRERDGCSLVTAKFAAMQRALAGTPIHLVEMTLDPAHDTPTVLAKYGREFGADPEKWSLLSGSPSVVRMMTDRFGITRAGDANGTFRHSDAVVVIDRYGRMADRIDGNDWSPAEIVASARSRSGLSSSLWLRLRLALGRGVGALCGGGRSGLTLGFALALFAGFLIGGAFVARRLVRTSPRSQPGSEIPHLR